MTPLDVLADELGRLAYATALAQEAPDAPGVNTGDLRAMWADLPDTERAVHMAVGLRLFRAGMEYVGADPDQPLTDDTLDLTTGVSAITGNGFVTVRWGPNVGQHSPAEAREMAVSWMYAAEAAETDARLYEIANTTSMTLGVSGAAAELITAMRAARTHRLTKDEDVDPQDR